MAWPDFIVIGGARCGTSALSVFLDQHPQISIPYKEPNFFTGWGSRVMFNGPNAHHFFPKYKEYHSAEAYTALLDSDPSALFRGDASIQYLMNEASAREILDAVPDVKLIAFLRQPVDRAYAHYNLYRSLGLEAEDDFLRCIEKEEERRMNNWQPTFCYLHGSRYAEQLRRYFKLFPREQIRVYLFDDWNEKPASVWGDLVAFIGADPLFEPDFKQRVAPTRRVSPLWGCTRRLRHGLRDWVPALLRRPLQKWASQTRYRSFPPLDLVVRAELTRRYFKEDILDLEEMLGVDLGRWIP